MALPAETPETEKPQDKMAGDDKKYEDGPHIPSGIANTNLFSGAELPQAMLQVAEVVRFQPLEMQALV